MTKLALSCVGLLAAPGIALAQSSLSQAATAARGAWMDHDTRALVGRGPPLYLQIPGSDPASQLGRDQAAALLERYLKPATEVSWDAREIREVEPDRGYVEAVRRYRVTGTDDERRETIFLGYRREGERWVLVEIRIAP